MGFSKQEYWSGLSFPSPGNLPHPGIKPQVSCFAGWFFTFRAPRGFKIYFGKFLRKHSELLDFHKLSLPCKPQPNKKYNQHCDTISTDSLPLNHALPWCSLTLLAWLFLLRGSAWLAVSSHSSLSADKTSESLPEVLNSSLPPWTCLNFPYSSYHTLFVSIFPTCKNPRGQEHSNLTYGGSLEN